jgi:hypothetical protein
VGWGQGRSCLCAHDKDSGETDELMQAGVGNTGGNALEEVEEMESCAQVGE